MAQGAAADSGVTPVMLTPILTERLTPAALTPKPAVASCWAADCCCEAAGVVAMLLLLLFVVTVSSDLTTVVAVEAAVDP